MIENILNKIIESIVLLHPSSVELGKPDRDTDTVTILFDEMRLLAGIFSEILPEEVKSFDAAVSGLFTDYHRPEVTTAEKNEKEIEIIALCEHHKNSVVYLNSLNRILIDKDYDNNIFEEFNQPYNLPIPHDQVHSSRDHYLEKLAESYVQGNTSDSIRYLLRTNNPIFLEHSSFIADVQTAVRITERDRLKKNMQSLDELEILNLPGSEIIASVTLAERDRMKEKMHKLDAEEIEGIQISETEVFQDNAKTKPLAKIVPIEKNKFAWIKYAVAAGIIGLIAISTVIIYNNKNSSPGIVRNKPDPSDTTKNIPGRDQNKKDALARNKWDSAEMLLNVRKENAMGFAVKQEEIKVRIYWLNEKTSASPELQKQIDSLNKQNNTYTFINNNLSVYLAIHDLPLLYKIDNKYYLEITDTLYHIRSSDKPTQLNKITNRNILNRIDKINYQQDSK